MEGNILQEYEIGDILEKGVNVLVRRCTHLESGRVGAVRVIDLEAFDEKQRAIIAKRLEKVKELMEPLQHPLLATPTNILINQEHACIFYDISEGPDLFVEVVHQAESGFVYSEAVASHYMKQVLEAVRHVHSKRYVHLNVRASDVCLATKQNSSPIRIGGIMNAFNLDEFEDNREDNEWCTNENVLCLSEPLVSCIDGKFGHLSSPCTRPPEAFPLKHPTTPPSHASDVWSLGCILHLLLYGIHPLTFGMVSDGDEDDDKESEKNHKQQQNHFNNNNTTTTTHRLQQPPPPLLHHHHRTDISEDARMLLQGMLEGDADKRVSLEQALAHPWIKDRSMVPKRHLANTVRNMARFNQYRALKDAIMTTTLDAYWSIPANHTPPNQTIQSELDVDLRGLEGVLRSLEGAEHLECPDSAPSSTEALLRDLLTNTYLNLFDNINDKLTYFLANKHQDGLFLRFNELLGDVGEVAGDAMEALKQLRNLFHSQPHLLHLFKSHDLIGRRLNNRRHSLHHGVTTTTATNNNNTIRSDNNNNTIRSCNNNINNTIRSYNNNNNTLMSLSPNNTATITSTTSSNMEPSEATTCLQLTFERDSDEPLGVTFRKGKRGRVVVVKIMENGMIHRLGLLREGDEIEGVNGEKLGKDAIEAIKSFMRDFRGEITLDIVRRPRSQRFQSERYLRALFSYDPSQETFASSPKACLPFSVGDVLKVVSVADEQWWQARHLGQADDQPCSLIPSDKLIEARVQMLDQNKEKKNKRGSWLFCRRQHKEKYLLKHNYIFDQLEVNSYEEVVHLPTFHYKTLVLLGAHGVGRRHIKNLLISNNAHKYAYPIPHTTRGPCKGEEHGRDYYFVSKRQMTDDIKANHFLEYGSHKGHLYGTRLDTIKRIHDEGLIAILDIEPQALKILRTAEYCPFVAFIAAPASDEKCMQQLVREDGLLQQTYGHLFNISVVNNDIDETIHLLQQTIEATLTEPQWVPVKWVY